MESEELCTARQKALGAIGEYVDLLEHHTRYSATQAGDVSIGATMRDLASMVGALAGASPLTRCGIESWDGKVSPYTLERQTLPCPQTLARQLASPALFPPAIVADESALYPVFFTGNTTIQLQDGTEIDVSRRSPPFDGPNMRVFACNALLLTRNRTTSLTERLTIAGALRVFSSPSQQASTTFRPTAPQLPFLGPDYVVDPNAVFIDVRPV